MTSHSNFKDKLLSELAILSHEEEVFYSVAQISHRVGVPEPVVRELLLLWAREQMFSMTTWSNARWKAVPWHEWPSDVASFFLNPDDTNCIRIRLQSAGREYAEILAKK